jgi:hypothetical protein
MEPKATQSESLESAHSDAGPADVQKTLPDEQLMESSQPTEDEENASDSALEAEAKLSDNSDEEPEGEDLIIILFGDANQFPLVPQEAVPVRAKVKSKTQEKHVDEAAAPLKVTRVARKKVTSSAPKKEEKEVKAEPKLKSSARKQKLSDASAEEAPPKTTRQRKVLKSAEKEQDDVPSPTKSASSTRSRMSAMQMPSRETRSRTESKTQGTALTTENLKKFEKQMRSSANTEATSSQETSSNVRRGRSQKSSVAPSRESSVSPVRSTRELRSRSQSVVSEILPAPRSRKRSISVASDKTVSSQRSTRSKKRKTDSDSDESTESGMVAHIFLSCEILIYFLRS